MFSPAHHLQHLRPKTHWLGEPTTGRIAVAPDLGGRLFAELDGQWLHRTQWESIANPGTAFNNDGGMNLWPGPEGGPFALNYDACGNWFVQPGINEVPFTLSHADEVSATLVKGNADQWSDIEGNDATKCLYEKTALKQANEVVPEGVFGRPEG